MIFITGFVIKDSMYLEIQIIYSWIETQKTHLYLMMEKKKVH